MRRCSGDYVLIIASDDWLDEGALEAMAAPLDVDSTIGLVHGVATIVDEQGSPVPERTGAPFPLGTHRDLELLLRGNFVAAPATLCRKQALIDAGPFLDYMYCQDWAMWLSVMVSGWNFHGLSTKVAYYRRHTGNLTHSRNQLRAAVDEIQMLEDFRRSHKHRLSTEQRNALGESLVRHRRAVGWLGVFGNERQLARASFARLLLEEPSVNAVAGLICSLLPSSIVKWLRRRNRQLFTRSKSTNP